MTGAALPVNSLRADLNAAILDGAFEGLPIGVVLIGIAKSEFRQHLIEPIRATHVTRDLGRVAAAGVGAGQHLSCLLYTS